MYLEITFKNMAAYAGDIGDQAAAFEAGVHSARVVRLENASHDVFRSNESEVLREIDDFVRSLPKRGGSPKP